MPKDRTNTIAIIGLTLLTPLLMAAAADERFAAYAIYIIALKSALTDIGMLFARDNKISDQEAKARVPDGQGGYVDASRSDTLTNLGIYQPPRK